MILERTHQGLEARIRPEGVGRFFSAGFLGFWLCGWVVGETFALFLLVRGAWALWTGEPPGENAEPLQLAPALAVGLFLLFWLTFWTFGGVMAMRELLRLLWSEVRLVAGPDLTIHERIGPFRSMKVIARSDLRRIYSIQRKCRLVAETTSGTLDLATVPREPDRESIEKALRGELRLEDPADQGGTPGSVVQLPEGWTEIVDAEGGVALVGDPAVRKKQARFTWTLAAGVLSVALLMISRMAGHPEWWAMAAMVSAAAAGLLWGAWRLANTRLEWRLGHGTLTLRRRTRAVARDLFDAASLELVETSDSDGDPWFTLKAVARATNQEPRRRRIASAMDDPSVPRRLGAWLAAKTRLPLDDQVGRSARPQQIVDLITQLEASGRFGRWIARRLPRQ